MLAFIFGTLMFFLPRTAAMSIGLDYTPQVGSLLKGLGGLIIGSGTINFLLRNSADPGAVRALLLTNIVTQLFGISADLLGVLDETLTEIKILPVQILHLFVGIGSIVYLSKLKSQTTGV